MGTGGIIERRCSRILGEKDTDVCGKPATVHVIYWWDPDVTEGGYAHGFCCDEHWQEYRNRWRCAGQHPVGHACGMPGSRVSPEGCIMDGLPVAEPLRRIAEAVNA
jgi:hypothetical protein